MLCTNASLPPLLPISVCVKMKAAVRHTTPRFIFTDSLRDILYVLAPTV